MTNVLTDVKKRGYKTRKMGKPTLTKLKKAVAKLSKNVFLSRELKHFDQGFNLTAIGSAGSIYQLDGMAQGDTEVLREGLVISPKSLQMRFELICEPSPSSTYNNCRVIIFRWYDETTPGVGDILTIPPSSGTYLWNGVYSWATKPQYQILFDKTVITDTDSYNSGMINFKYKFPPLAKIQYQGSSSPTQKGGLYMLYINDSLAIPHPVLNGFTRLTFTDS